MSESMIKVTIPTQMTWSPGQFIYLRMPGISLFDSHPFTIASLCSKDFQSVYGEGYRDCTVVFRSLKGFTRKVLEAAHRNGPEKTYRAYLEGPYGGMRRELPAFETVILLAGGSGITAIISQLVHLVKRMRDGKAVTTKIIIVWSKKSLESLQWFFEELAICRQHAPPDSITCRFHVTGATAPMASTRHRPNESSIGSGFQEKLEEYASAITEKRLSARRAAVKRTNNEACNATLTEEHKVEVQDTATTASNMKPEVQRKFTPTGPGDLKGPSSQGVSLHQRQSMIDDHAASRSYFSDANPHALHINGVPPPPSHPPPPLKYDAARIDLAVPCSNSTLTQPLVPIAHTRGVGLHVTIPASHPRHNIISTESASSQGHSASAMEINSSTQLLPPSNVEHYSGYRPNTMFELSGNLPLGAQCVVDDPENYAAHLAAGQQHNDIASGVLQSPVLPVPPPVAHFGRIPTGYRTPIAEIAPASSNGIAGALVRASLTGLVHATPKSADPVSSAATEAVGPAGDWDVQYGRPDLALLLRDLTTGGRDGRGSLGRRTCVFVCGPPEMRVSVARTVAALQAEIWGDESKDEIFLHTELYSF